MTLLDEMDVNIKSSRASCSRGTVTEVTIITEIQRLGSHLVRTRLLHNRLLDKISEINLSI